MKRKSSRKMILPESRRSVQGGKASVGRKSPLSRTLKTVYGQSICSPKMEKAWEKVRASMPP